MTAFLGAFAGAVVGAYVMRYGGRWTFLRCMCGKRHWWRGRARLKCPNGGGEFWRE